MGGGEYTGAPFTTTVAYVQTAAPQCYSLNIVMPAGSVDEGIYRVILRLLLGTGGTTPICGFDDSYSLSFIVSISEDKTNCRAACA